MDKIRILVDARVVGGEGQGSVTYLRGMYNAFFEQYNEHYELFFAGYDYVAMEQAFPFLDEEHFIALSTESRLKLFLWEFPRIIDRYGIKFAHFQYVTPFVKNCKFIVTTHDVLFLEYPKSFSFWYRMKRKFLFLKGLQKSEIRLTVSKYSKNEIVKHFDLNPASISITPNAVYPEFFIPFSKTMMKEYIRNKFGIENYILYVSRIEPRKNHELLIKAYKELQLAQVGIQLVFIGNNTLGDKQITQEMESLKAAFPGKFHWIEFAEDEDLVSFYQAARLFVYPSKAEGFGIPPIEAAAVGINTLCSNTTAMQDFEFFEENLFSPDNLEELKIKMKKNLFVPIDMGHLKRISRAIKTQYNWNNSARVLHKMVLAESFKALDMESLQPTNNSYQPAGHQQRVEGLSTVVKERIRVRQRGSQ